MIEMVPVAQLVEHPVVVRDVAGSSPVWHPTHPAKVAGLLSRQRVRRSESMAKWSRG